MSTEPTGDATGSETQVRPPELPARLRDPRPVIAVITLGWLIAAVAAFTVSSLQSWRPVTLAGLGLAVLGTGIFLWQRHEARAGARGAQSGLD
ncbi:DUF2530 domain-containing protein [Mycobacterium sp.]|jgi:hypothetical protein|uniref:DUF2530 domain-containing protein n=1 Tax=Mycobacterium sp. TaxID=1785 RepID=UPI002D3EC619|nr:DUF2530 domain-containing protein [Mycobacterium sp.]HZA08622.1 DUF2530 domain-containing protein [Mycobacterium sp.]